MTVDELISEFAKDHEDQMRQFAANFKTRKASVPSGPSTSIIKN